MIDFCYDTNMSDDSESFPNPIPLDQLELRVIQLLRQGPCFSRADLVDETGLSRSRLNQVLLALQQQNWITPSGAGDSTGGRPPMLFSFNKNARYALGLDFGATGCRVGISNLAGEILAMREELLDIKMGPDAAFAVVLPIVHELLHQQEIRNESILGIGIGVPGPVEFLTGRPISPPIMPGWDGCQISDFFRKDFTCPVFVDNDVNVMALGEQWAGAGQGVGNFFFIKVATGIGAGLICNGHIYRGAQGCAGDVGHIMADPSGPRCNCGNIGCLEAMAAAPAIVRQAVATAQEDRSPVLADLLASQGQLTAVDVGRAAAEGDQSAIDIIRQSGRLIGQVLAGLVNFYNPSLIVIGGGVSRVGHLLLATIRETVYRRSLSLSTQTLSIVTSALGNRAGVIGCSMMAIEETLAASAITHERLSTVLVRNGGDS
jgi:glucokinase-like ROK family protein